MDMSTAVASITVAVLAPKGGTGKTTLAVNMAVAAGLGGRAATVIDLDPLASASGWRDQRGSAAPEVAVISAHAARLGEVLDGLRAAGAGFVAIDTAAQAEQTSLLAARAADMVLIPCRPAMFDLRAIDAAHNIAQLAKVASAAIINAAPPRGPLADEAEQAIRGCGLTVAPARLGHRMAFVHAATRGLGVLEYRPTGKAAAELAALYAWFLQQTGEP